MIWNTSVMVWNTGSIVMRHMSQKFAKKNQKKCKLGKEGGSACLKKERGCVEYQPQCVETSPRRREFGACCGWSRTTQPHSRVLTGFQFWNKRGIDVLDKSGFCRGLILSMQHRGKSAPVHFASNNGFMCRSKRFSVTFLAMMASCFFNAA
jgi:hypothetical protein